MLSLRFYRVGVVCAALFLGLTACSAADLSPAATTSQPAPLSTGTPDTPGVPDNQVLAQTPAGPALEVTRSAADRPVLPAGAAPVAAPSLPTAMRAEVAVQVAVTQAITATPAVSLTSAITATPAVPFTSTIMPAQGDRLQNGRWLQTIGDCEGARREFAAVVSGAGSSLAPSVTEARYRMGECYLRDAAPAEAERVLSELLGSAAQDDPYRAPASFLLGEAQTTLGSWDAAQASYSRYLQLVPDLSSVAWQRIANVRAAAGNLVGATEAYTRALTASPDWATTVALRRALAGVLLRRGDGRGAAAQFDALRGDQTRGAWAAEMQWLAGSAFSQGGDKLAAVLRLQAAIAADPTTQFAHQALIALVDAGVPVDEFQRGLVDYYNDVYQLAIDAFQRVRAVDANGHDGQAWYYMGLSYLALDRYDQAIAELGNFIAAFPNSPLWNDAWLAKARAQAAAGDSAGAIATYRQFAAEHPAAPQAPLALMQVAGLQAQAGDAEAAGQAYLEVARRYPQSDQGWRSYMNAGLGYFRRGDYRQAGDVWGDMAADSRLDAWARAVGYYWLGRTQAAAGEDTAARTSWEQSAQAGPDTYYGQRAAGRLAGASVTLFGPGSLQFPADTAIDGAELAAWLRSWAGEGSLALSPSVQADADWRRGQALVTIGLRSSGKAAWARLQTHWAGDAWAQAALALAFRDAGENDLSITCAERVAALAPAGARQKLPLALERLQYPLALAPLVREEAQHWGVDPLLVAAVIRQESRFEAGATSSAVAQGLMQIIPDTAEWIAGQLGWSNFAPDEVYRPYINVQFGTYYLRRQIDAFDNSIATALSAYNGGPGNAIVWRKRAPADEDLMVALIDLPESRLYVQLVWQHYEAYSRLYPR